MPTIFRVFEQNERRIRRLPIRANFAKNRGKARLGSTSKFIKIKVRQIGLLSLSTPRLISPPYRFRLTRFRIPLGW